MAELDLVGRHRITFIRDGVENHDDIFEVRLPHPSVYHRYTAEDKMCSVIFGLFLGNMTPTPRNETE